MQIQPNEIIATPNFGNMHLSHLVSTKQNCRTWVENITSKTTSGLIRSLIWLGSMTVFKAVKRQGNAICAPCAVIDLKMWNLLWRICPTIEYLALPKLALEHQEWFGYWGTCGFMWTSLAWFFPLRDSSISCGEHQLRGTLGTGLSESSSCTKPYMKHDSCRRRRRLALVQFTGSQISGVWVILSSSIFNELLEEQSRSLLVMACWFALAKEMAKQATMETQLYPGHEDDDDSYDDMEASETCHTLLLPFTAETHKHWVVCVTCS